MKRILRLTGIFAFIALVTIGCGGKKKINLSALETELVNTSVAIGCEFLFYKENPNTTIKFEEAYSQETKVMIHKYQINSNWEFHYPNTEMKSTMEFSVNGEMRIEIHIPINVGENFISNFVYDGVKYEVRLTKGDIGIHGGNVYIEKDTKMSFNGIPYIYENNAWIKGNVIQNRK